MRRHPEQTNRYQGGYRAKDVQWGVGDHTHQSSDVNARPPIPHAVNSGRRIAHLTTRSGKCVRRARIGSFARYRRKSSPIASALP